MRKQYAMQKRKLLLGCLILITLFSSFYMFNPKITPDPVVDSDSLVLTTPISQNQYLDARDFYAWDEIIIGPSYLEFYQYQYRNVEYRINSPFPRDFDRINVFWNGTLVRNEGNDGDLYSINIGIGDHYETDQIGTGLLEIKIRSRTTGEWISKNVTVNTSYKTASIFPYYDDFAISAYQSWNYLSWDITYNYGSMCSYYIYVNGVQKGYQYDSYNQYIDFSYSTLGITNPGTYNISFFLQESYNYYTFTNNFTITVEGENYPEINNFYIDNLCNNYFYLWQSEANIHISAYDQDNDLDRVELFLVREDYNTNEIYPLKTIKDVDFSQDQIFTINSYDIGSIVDLSDVNPYDYLYYKIRAFAIDRNGRYQQWNGGEIGFDLKFHPALTAAESLSIDALSGRNVETLIIPEEYDLEYRATIVIDALSSNKVDLHAIAGRKMNDAGGMDDFKRSNDVYDLFEYRDYQQHYLPLGMVFWIGFENSSAIDFPIIMKITYPSFIEPDAEIDDPPLRLLKYVRNNCYGSDEYWRRLDDQITNVNNISHYVEITINEPGFYAFGADAMDYWDGYDGDGDGMNIPGFPVPMLISLIGLTIMLKAKKLRK